MLAQDEASSVVYGMPREAVAEGVVDAGLPTSDIAAYLRTLPGRGCDGSNGILHVEGPTRRVALCSAPRPSHCRSCPKAPLEWYRVTMTKRVLVVEDSPTQTEVLRGELESAVYEIEIAVNGEEGLARFDAQRFDLVISHIVMPGAVDGYELCRRIKAGAGRRTPVVLLTSFTDPLDIIVRDGQFPHQAASCGAPPRAH